MAELSNIQHILSNISSIERVQQIQHHQGEVEQSRILSQVQDQDKKKGEKIENANPADIVDISIRDDRSGKDESRKRKQDRDQEETDEFCAGSESIDIIV